MGQHSADDIFQQYLLPLYPDDSRADLARARTTDANPSRNPSILAHIDEAASRFQSLMGKELGIALDGTDASVHRLGAALTSERRAQWLGAKGTAESPLVNFLVHGSLYVGRCAVRNHGGEWCVRRPLWETLVFLKSGVGELHMPPLHWLLKSLSDEELGRATLGDRYRMYVEEPGFDWMGLPVLAVQGKAPVRLKSGKYDVFYKYIKAHLAELRDLGPEFPTPERFDELRIQWLDAHWVGGGRLCLLVLLGATGLHLYWLDAAGFRKGMYIACESFPEPRVKLAGEKVEIVSSQNGRVVTQEFMWWGP
jgi:hypothetical protein